MATPKIAPCLWFNGEAEDAASFYVSLFPDSRIESVSRYGDTTAGVPASFPKGTALMVEFTLAGQRFQALNGGPQFSHSEAISLSISCRDAQEVDHYWNALTANGGAEGPCGWLKDRFGVSWQVVPDGLGALLSDGDSGRAGRAMQAMLGMKKLDLAAMRNAAAAGDRQAGGRVERCGGLCRTCDRRPALWPRRYCLSAPKCLSLDGLLRVLEG